MKKSNCANRNLMDAEDIGYAISSIVYHHCQMELLPEPDAQAAHDACVAFGQYFCGLMNGRAEEFAPHAKQWNLLQQIILVILENEALTVTQLAQMFMAAGDKTGNLQTARRYIHEEIQTGRLSAKKRGYQYEISPEAAAEWLANPARGSRTED